MFCLEHIVLFLSLLSILPQSSLLYTPFGRDIHELEFIRILYVLHLYLLSYIVFYSSASLISFRARWWFYFIEIIYLSCFTYIIVRVLKNSMVICFGYKISPNMIGIQVGYNKNFHIKCIEYYEKFDT